MRIKVDDEPCFLFDFPVLGAALALIMIGLIMVTSASMTVSVRIFGNPIHFLVHQSIFATTGLVGSLYYKC